MLERQVHLLAAELDWLDTVIARQHDAQDQTNMQGGTGA
jgi:hypothetical protein